MSIKLKVVPQKVLFENESYGVKICKDIDEDSFITVIGNVGCLQLNQEYEIVVKEIEHPRYGIQYELITVPSLDNIEITAADEIPILLSFMNQKQADNIHSVYPNFVAMIVDGKENEIDLNKIKGVGERRFNEYVEKINHVYRYQKIINMFPDYKFTLKECKKLFQAYYNYDKIYEELEKNPYHVLIDILERGFIGANNTILKINPSFLGSEIQTEYLLLHILTMNEAEGNTKINANVVASLALEMIPECFQKIKKVVEERDTFFYENDTKFIAKMSTYQAERNIANNLLERKENPRNINLQYEKYKSFLSEEQQEVLKKILNEDVLILCGPAGSGKTSTIKALIEMLDSEFLSYILLAPTGIAAKRLKDVTERYTSTIHKELAKNNYIDADVVIIDEFSFVGVKIFSKLLNNISTSSKILLVCDEQQLPSISCGNVLRDILRSQKIPTVKLSKIFRYGENALLTVATDIRNKKEYLNQEGPIFDGYQPNKEYKFIPIGNNPLQQIVNEYKNLLTKYSKNDIVVLSPFNVGSMGTYAINTELQNICNPLKGEEIVKKISTKRGNIEMRFRVGDKVINTKNNYNAITNIDYYEKGAKFGNATVVNGDMGVVEQVDVENKCLVVKFQDDSIVYTYSEMNNLLLGYSISTHKSQGSEFLSVINITHPSHNKLLNKNLLYVANTRAKELLVEVGDVKTINNAIKVEATDCRETFLYELLKK